MEAVTQIIAYDIRDGTSLPSEVPAPEKPECEVSAGSLARSLPENSLTGLQTRSVKQLNWGWGAGERWRRKQSRGPT